MQLHKAARRGDLEAIQAALAAGEAINRRNRDGETPLARAATMGKLAACQMLLEAGADVRALDNFNRSILHHAVRSRKLPVVRLILEHPVDLNLVSDNESSPLDGETPGYSPFMMAFLQDSKPLAELLAEEGADVNLPDGHFYTPLDRAKQFGLRDWIKLLRELGAEEGDEALIAQRDAYAAEHAAAHEADARLPFPAEFATVPERLSTPVDEVFAARDALGTSAQTASVSAFVTQLGDITGHPWKPSRIRPGTFMCKLRPADQNLLATHFELPLPFDAEVKSRGRARRAATLFTRLQEAAEAAGCYLVECELTGSTTPKLVVFANPQQLVAVAASGTTGQIVSDDGPQPIDTDLLVAWLLDLQTTQPFKIIGCGSDFVSAVLTQPPADPQALAERIFAFCPDIVEQGCGSVKHLAHSLEHDRSFFLWWD